MYNIYLKMGQKEVIFCELFKIYSNEFVITNSFLNHTLFPKLIVYLE